MSSSKPNEPAPPPVPMDYLAGLLSYLVPGLGQITQGRVGKGVLFLVCLYGLFFYGMSLGSWKNVYLPDYHPHERSTVNRLGSDIYARFQFVGQFPMGMVVWPALYQYRVATPDEEAAPIVGHDPERPEEAKAEAPKRAPGGLFKGWMRAPDVNEINRLQRDGDKTWDLGWVYTVIAGVLNVLVIYDALAGPAFRTVTSKPEGEAR